MQKLRLLLAGLLIGLMPICGFAQQQTVGLPTTHQAVREALNSNATDSESRLTILEAAPPFIVNTPSDLDVFKSGSVYTLPPDNYSFTASMDFGTDTIILGTASGCYVFQGSCLELITYTGLTPFITGSTGLIFEIRNLFLTTPNATCIELSNGNSIITDTMVLFTCELGMNLETFEFLTLVASPIIACDDGIQATNIKTITARLPQFNAGANVGGSYLNVDGAASERMIMSTMDARPESSESFLNIAANYGGDISIVGGVLETGGGTFFNASGRDQTDLSIIVEAVKNVQNSRYVASLHISPGDEASTAIVLDTQVVIAGTFTEDLVERFTTNAAGRVTYTGKETGVFNFTVKFLVTPASGINKNYDFYLRLNGTTLIDISFDTVNVDSGTPGKAILIGEVELSTTDFLELVVIARSPNPTNITCEALSFVIF